MDTLSTDDYSYDWECSQNGIVESAKNEAHNAEPKQGFNPQYKKPLAMKKSVFFNLLLLFFSLIDRLMEYFRRGFPRFI